jgi:cation diffusion facilitator family transporter
MMGSSERSFLMSSGGSTKVVIVALASNLGIAAAKFAGAFYSGSAALMAESIHSVVDCSNQVLLLVGNKKSKQAPTELHPLGFGREAFFWSFIVSILLFSLGGLFAIYEGVHKLNEHEPVSSPLLGLGILAVSCALEAYSFRACLHEVKTQNPYGSLWQWFHKTTASELLVIFTEDAAALAGLCLATISLLLSWYTGNAVWDALGSIMVGALLVVVAILLAVEIKSLIIGEAPSTDFKTFIQGRVSALIPGGKVLKLIAVQVGAHEVLISCKVTPGSVEKVSDLIAAINQIEKETKKQFPEIRWQFFEPDITD